VGLAADRTATNASKYGALSDEDRHSVEVCWRLDRQHLTMNWTERGGPLAVGAKTTIEALAPPLLNAKRAPRPEARSLTMRLLASLDFDLPSANDVEAGGGA